MWPPSRASARSASSRFTRPPSSTSPSDERRSVSCMTSAPKRSPQIPTAVRHTPLTATESPSPSSRASGDSTVSRTPSAVRSTRATCARSATSPVNIPATASPLAQPRRDEDVAPGRQLAVEGQRAQRVLDPLDARALERDARAPPAQQQRGQEQADLVDLADV